MLSLLFFIVLTQSQETVQTVTLGKPRVLDLKPSTSDYAEVRIKIDAPGIDSTQKLYLNIQSCGNSGKKFKIIYNGHEEIVSDILNGQTPELPSHIRHNSEIDLKEVVASKSSFKVAVLLLSYYVPTVGDELQKQNPLKNLTIASKAISEKEKSKSDTVGKTVLLLMDIPKNQQIVLNATTGMKIERKYDNPKNYWYIQWGDKANPKACDNVCCMLTESHFGHSVNMGEYLAVNSTNTKTDHNTRVTFYSSYKSPFLSMYFNVIQPQAGARNFTVMYADQYTLPQFSKVVSVQGASSVMMLLCLLIFVLLF